MAFFLNDNKAEKFAKKVWNSSYRYDKTFQVKKAKVHRNSLSQRNKGGTARDEILGNIVATGGYFT